MTGLDVLLLVLKNFEALAMSLPRLGPAQLRSDGPLSLPPSGIGLPVLL